MRPDFLTPHIDRLSADGSLQTLTQGTTLGRLLQKPVILIARDYCSFSHLKTANLPRTRRRQAAQLHARTTAPYILSSWVLSKSQEDFGIWWWDETRVNRHIEAAGLKPARLSLYPETLAQPVVQQREDHWRIVKLANGYEAQFWRDRGLVASAWRPSRYDDASWASFVRLQRDAERAPEHPPEPTTLPVVPMRQTWQSIEISPQTAGWIAAGTLATASLCLAAFISGQTWQLEKDTTAITTETARIRATTPRAATVADLNEAQKMLLTYSQLEAETNPLSAAGAAIGILAYHEVTLQKIEVETESVRVVIGYHQLKIMNQLIEDLQTSGYFHDVRPRSDVASNTITIDMKVHEAAPPLNSLE